MAAKTLSTADQIAWLKSLREAWLKGWPSRYVHQTEDALESLLARLEASVSPETAAECDKLKADNPSLQQTLDMTEQERLDACADWADMKKQRDEAVDRLQAILDWCDLCCEHPDEFDRHGVKNTQGPVFDQARQLIASLASGDGEL